MEKQFIRIPKWGEFQHYKDRSPPWIKLHKSMLASETWVTLDDASRVLAIACMLLAADTDNKTPLNLAYIKRVAYLNSEPDFSALIATGFVEIIEENDVSLADASSVLAKRTECPPEERRGEEKAEFVLPDWIPADSWAGFEEARRKMKKPMTDRARKLAVAELEKLTKQGFSAQEIIDRSVLNNWQSFYAPKAGVPERNGATTALHGRTMQIMTGPA